MMIDDYYAYDKQRMAFSFGTPRDIECSLNLESHMLGFNPEIWNSSLRTLLLILPSASASFLILSHCTYFIKATIKVRNDKIRGVLTAIILQPSHLYSFVQSHKPTFKVLTGSVTP